jgi:hypothetical protein
MRIYYDTEFTSLDGNVDWDMISAGFISETGEEWYVEITNFLREDCSPFVVETVLPLLGMGDTAPERMASTHFAWRFCNWLETFKEPIQLVSDHSVDWHIIQGYCYAEFAAFPVKVQGQVWIRSDKPSIQRALVNVEKEFWEKNPGMIHHALYDARRLALNALIQRDMQRVLFGIEP